MNEHPTKQAQCPMKLNDPFGRVNRRQHSAYLALRDRLRAQGVRDTDAVAGIATHMSRTALWLVLATVLLGAMTTLVIPALAGVTLVLGILALIWIGMNFFQARMHLKRYVLQECQTQAESTATPTESVPPGGKV